jgi:hypothetical protein
MWEKRWTGESFESMHGDLMQIFSSRVSEKKHLV